MINPSDVILEGNAQVVEEKDFETQRQEMGLQIRNSPEVQELALKIDVGNPQSVLLFGQEAAEEISKFSDMILRETTKNEVTESGNMLKDLAGIMKSFEPKDFEDKKPTVLRKMFNKVGTNMEKLLNKYQTMDKNIENVFVQVKEYEKEIQKSTYTMEDMYDENAKYYMELEKYIAAGESIRDTTLNEWLPELQAATEAGDPLAMQRYNDAKDFVELIDQRIQDLEMAKMVSVQTAPQIKLIQKGNYNLMRKINSALVVTIPVFKNGLAQAITMKRQRIQANSLRALDETTNQMLMRNAENISANSIDITKLAGESSIRMETLETTFQTIMSGIEETILLEEDNRKKREEGRKQISNLTLQLKEKF